MLRGFYLGANPPALLEDSFAPSIGALLLGEAEHRCTGAPCAARPLSGEPRGDGCSNGSREPSSRVVVLSWCSCFITRAPCLFFCPPLSSESSETAQVLATLKRRQVEISHTNRKRPYQVILPAIFFFFATSLLEQWGRGGSREMVGGRRGQRGPDLLPAHAHLDNPEARLTGAGSLAL